MKVAFNGILEQAATFLSDNTEAGVPVSISANGTVAACAAGGQLAGVAISADKGMNAVQLYGYVQLPYSGTTAPTLGFNELVGDGACGVKTASGGRKCLVVELDTTAKRIGLFL